MKVDLIRKYRWYIVGLIMSFIMISISLSFCLWDDNSLKSLKANGGSGDYNEYIVVPGKQYKIAVDKYKDDNLTEGKNGIANVGDIVTFGKYYQETNDSIKTDLRWIVVNSENSTLTLLAESVVAFGSFWNDEWYYNTNGSATGSIYYNQRYNTSTVKEWLNSENRTDGGVGFTINDSKRVFNGFYKEAFDFTEQNAVIPRTIGSMTGYYGYDGDPNNGNNGGRTTAYGDLPNQKVWVPSWREIYGNVNYNGNNLPVNDASSDKQFSYFNGVIPANGNNKLIGKTTPFASSASISNYTTKAATHQANSRSVSAGSVSPVWWWLRSPDPGDYGNALMVYPGGQGSYNFTYISHGGVRPAVCLAQ